LLTGAYRLSKAKVAYLLADLFAIPLCAGQVCAIEAEVGQHLQQVVDEPLAAARLSAAVVGIGFSWLFSTRLPSGSFYERGR
jgi:hypothetical protein